MVSSATVTIVGILKHFHGMKLVVPVAPAVIRRYTNFLRNSLFVDFPLLLFCFLLVALFTLLLPRMNVLLVQSTSLQVSKSLVVSGPLWTGPLHDTAFVTQMLNLAEEWGWAESGSGTHLDKL